MRWGSTLARLTNLKRPRIREQPRPLRRRTSQLSWVSKTLLATYLEMFIFIVDIECYGWGVYVAVVWYWKVTARWYLNYATSKASDKQSLLHLTFMMLFLLTFLNIFRDPASVDARLCRWCGPSPCRCLQQHLHSCRRHALLPRLLHVDKETDWWSLHFKHSKRILLLLCNHPRLWINTSDNYSRYWTYFTENILTEQQQQPSVILWARSKLFWTIYFSSIIWNVISVWN